MNNAEAPGDDSHELLYYNLALPYYDFSELEAGRQAAAAASTVTEAPDVVSASMEPSFSDGAPLRFIATDALNVESGAISNSSDSEATSPANPETADVPYGSGHDANSTTTPSNSESFTDEPSVSTLPKRSNKSKRAKNWEACGNCQRDQKACKIVQREPRLCLRCKEKGVSECPPHIPRGRKIQSSGTYIPYGNHPGRGKIDFFA